MASSRVRHLEETLSILHFDEALRAFDLVVSEMSAEKGYVRHNGTHYYYHLVDVAQKLLNFGIRDEDIIVAALLHDIVEDVPGYTIDQVSHMFNSRVAHMVNLVTKKPGIDYKIAEHMESYLEEISFHVGASLIKAADRMHNFGTLRDASPEKKLRQALETETFFIPFFKKCRNMYPRYAAFFFEAKTQIEPHLWEIKSHHEEVSMLKKKIMELESKQSKKAPKL
jgi:(p)ppGpp synthase/HD superfamily hydrolase